MEKTLSYSNSANGWTSFHSFIPDMMDGMNGDFYSFKGGALYKHNSNPIRNNFYGIQYDSKLSLVFNAEPWTTKVFNTIGIDGSSPWECYTTTELSTGYIGLDYFKLKEGSYTTYIRRNLDDGKIDLRSAQGIGRALGISYPSTKQIDIVFPFNIGSIVAVGDILYSTDGRTSNQLGPIVQIGIDSVRIDKGTIDPSAEHFFMYIKNNTAESYGQRGDYMQVDMINSDTDHMELSSVESSVFKSYP